jgi:hypothetical protein
MTVTRDVIYDLLPDYSRAGQAKIRRRWSTNSSSWGSGVRQNGGAIPVPVD